MISTLALVNHSLDHLWASRLLTHVLIESVQIPEGRAQSEDEYQCALSVYEIQGCQ